VALLLAACGAPDDGPPGSCGPSSATVERVIDGDTIMLTDGTRVRYLLINAPETTLGHHDCYGAEATDFNRSLVDGQRVELGYDVRCLDKYGRTLAFIRSGGIDVNRALIDRGLACYEFIPPDGEARHEEFKSAESVAKANRIGLWGACATVTCGG